MGIDERLLNCDVQKVLGIEWYHAEVLVLKMLSCIVALLPT